MKFKVGDRIKVVFLMEDYAQYKKYLNNTGYIISIDEFRAIYRISCDDGVFLWYDKELILCTRKAKLDRILK